MNIVIPLKPVVMRARTRDELVSKIRSNYHTVSVASNRGHHYRTRDDRIVAFNLQKVRPKFRDLTPEELKKEKKRLRGIARVKRVKVRSGEWIAYVYVFNKDFPVNVWQGTRSFEFKIDKRKISINNT